jgi:hypothetical protein
VLLRTVALSVLAVCALAAQVQDRPAPPPPPPREATERGALAILRRDGIIFPFASFNRDTWRITWPIDLSTQTLPATIREVPERWWGTRTPELWNAFLPSGAPQAIELRDPVQFRAHCSRRLGLRTTYRSALALPPVPAEPFPKDGVAVSGYARIEPIETVAETSPDWKLLEASLQKAFDRVEQFTLTGVSNSTGWRHPLKEEERRRGAFRLESWYRSPGHEPGWTVSYVEAVRQYPPRPEDKGCGLETLVTGWVHHFKGELKEADELRGKITYCDRVGAAYMLPLGRIRPRDHSYWIFQLSGWDEEWYEVVRVDEGRVRHVIEVLAGNRLACS